MTPTFQGSARAVAVPLAGMLFTQTSAVMSLVTVPVLATEIARGRGIGASNSSTLLRCAHRTAPPNPAVQKIRLTIGMRITRKSIVMMQPTRMKSTTPYPPGPMINALT